MTLHPIYLVIALILLWWPRQWLQLGRRKVSHRGVSSPPFARRRQQDERARIGRDPNDRSVHLRSELGRIRSYIDLVRSGAGIFVLTRWSFTATPEAGRNLALVIGAIVLIGTLIQTVRPRRQLELVAPIWYLSGLTFGMGDWYLALFALCLLWAIGFVLPGPALFLTAYAVLFSGFHYGFDRVSLPVLLMSGMIILPVLLSLLSGRPLELRLKRLIADSGPESK